MLKEKATLERVVKLWSALNESYEDAEAMRELAEEAEDLETMDEASEMFRALVPQVDEAEIQQMLSEEADPMDAVLEVNSGAGGTDASDFAQMLLRMYRQWSEDGLQVQRGRSASREAGSSPHRSRCRAPTPTATSRPRSACTGWSGSRPSTRCTTPHSIRVGGRHARPRR